MWSKWQLTASFCHKGTVEYSRQQVLGTADLKLKMSAYATVMALIQIRQYSWSVQQWCTTLVTLHAQQSIQQLFLGWILCCACSVKCYIYGVSHHSDMHNLKCNCRHAESGICDCSHFKCLNCHKTGHTCRDKHCPAWLFPPSYK